jgi:hypothetical protein
MSNRFRNLKLGRTFTLTTNKLAPLPDLNTPQQDETLKSNSSIVSLVDPKGTSLGTNEEPAKVHGTVSVVLELSIV